MPLRKIDGGKSTAAKDAEPEADEGDLDAEQPGQPVSGKRRKKGSQHVQLLVSELIGRSKGLEGAELQAEIDRFIDRVVEHQVKAAPVALREELRTAMRGMIEEDPYVGGIVAKLRAARG